jgi:hypothetical protein
MATPETLYSSMLRAGKTTYFLDVRKAKNGAKFLSISESRIDGDEKRHRSTVRLFGETMEQFRQAVEEAAGEMGKAE